MLIIVFSIICLTGCGLVNTLRIRNANDDIHPMWEGKQFTVLKTHYIGVKPYVEVAINGIDGFKFLIDTGASFSILMDTAKVKQLELKEGYQLQLHGWGDEEYSPAYQTEAKKLSLAGVDFNDVTFAYLPLSSSNYYLHHDELIFDGVLGHDVLHHFSWKFDKKNNQISISKKPYQLAGDEISLAFDVSLSKLVINSQIDFGQNQIVPQELIIDTGSRHYLKVNAAFINNESIKLPEPQITAADFGLSGQTIHQRVTLPNLILGDLSLTDVKTNVIGNLDDDEDEYWIIGSALLNQFVTVIDYHSSMLHIIPYSGVSYRSHYNLLGLELRKLNSGDFIVRYTFPQMVASNFDFKKGDIINQIDGIPSKDISLEQWLSISDSAGNHEICRTRKTQKCFKMESKHILGYSITD